MPKSALARLSGLAGLILCLTVAGAAFAGTVQIAVAANFTEPAKEIGAAFEKATGDKAVFSFGASGPFYTQIRQGAPFEVFLSADAERPVQAEKAGLAVPGARFTYAYGVLMLWSAAPNRVDPKGEVLAKGAFAKLAIADPAAAPYGLAAVETLKKLNLYDRLAPKIVKGATIAQTHAFISTGAADLGFVALSQIIKTPGGSSWRVPAEDYAPITQQAVLLKTGAHNPAAKAFFDFLKSPAAAQIITSYGYGLK